MITGNINLLNLFNNYVHRLIFFPIALPIILLLMPIISFAQIQTSSFEFEGRMRDYFVFLPKNYNGVTKMPVVFDLHGYTLSAQQQMDYSQMNMVADTAGFIVVYPNALNTTWNSGIYDSPIAPPNPNVNDVGFIDALIDTLSRHYSINLDMVYSCGFSNGGFMSFRLACELSNRIAAIASVAGVISNTIAGNCDAKHKMPVFMIHGTNDEVVPYYGAAGWHSVEYTINHWMSFNLCTESDTLSMPDVDPSDGSTVKKIEYTHCSGDISVMLYKVINGGHSWPGGDKQYLHLSIGPVGNTNGDINASAEIWKFFKTYKLSEATGVEAYLQHPIEFSLIQNHPNPFNPSTRIQYAIGNPANGTGREFVSLKVYDILGNEIATLVNEQKPAGTYEVTWNARNLSSGVYFYKLQAGSYVETKKMLMMK
jgi:polyhydroxybutyrate depolymerase